MAVEYQRPIEIGELAPSYESRFPLEMGILRIGGVHPIENRPMRNPYTGQIETESFANVGEHSIAVAMAAEKIAGSVLGEGDPRIKKVVSQALVHDATKRLEIYGRKANLPGVSTPSFVDTVRGVFEAQGLPAVTVDYLVQAGKETGEKSLPQFVTVDKGKVIFNTQAPLEDMIVHLADDMTSTNIPPKGEKAQTHFLTPAERMEASGFTTRYPWMYTTGFGISGEGEIIYTNGETHNATAEIVHTRTYADWQVWVSGEIAKHLIQISGAGDEEVTSESAIRSIKALLNTDSS